MNNREIFEKVKTHLLTQNARAVGDDGITCLYRAPDDKMCAVGCLIPDYAYDRKYMEYNTFYNFTTVLIDAGVPESAFDMLKALQGMHDYQPVESWPDHLDLIENEYL